jgi:hypothetical protein
MASDHSCGAVEAICTERDVEAAWGGIGGWFSRNSSSHQERVPVARVLGLTGVAFVTVGLGFSYSVWQGAQNSPSQEVASRKKKHPGSIQIIER